MNNILLLVITLSPAIVFILQSRSEMGKTRTLLHFFQYGDPLPKRSFWATLAASNSALSAAIYLIAIYGYFYGVGVFLWTMLFWFITQYASRVTIQVVEKTEEHNGGFLSRNGTLHEFFGNIYQSQSVRVFAAVLSAITYLGLLSCELKLGHEIILGLWPSEVDVNQELPFFSWVVLLAIIFLVVGYTALAGFRGVIRTDAFQVTLMMIMLVTIWIVSLPSLPTIIERYSELYATDIASALFNPDGGGVLNFVLFFGITNVIFWMCWWPVAMDQWHRCAATQSAQAVLDPVYGTTGMATTCYLALLTLSSLLVGVFVRILVMPEGGESYVLFYFLDWVASNADYHQYVRILFAGLLGAGLLAAVLSTTDTYLIVACQSLVSDIFFVRHGSPSLRHASEASSESSLPYVRRLVVLMYFIPVCFLYLIAQVTDVYTLIYGFFTLMISSAPALLFGLLGWRGERYAPLAKLSIALCGFWALTSGAYIVYTIDSLQRAGRIDDALQVYLYMYTNPIVTICIGSVVYFIGHFFVQKR